MKTMLTCSSIAGTERKQKPKIALTRFTSRTAIASVARMASHAGSRPARMKTIAEPYDEPETL